MPVTATVARRWWPQTFCRQDFRAHEKNKAWVTDITYIRTWRGWLYLAVVIDFYSESGRLVDEAILAPAAGSRCPL